MTNLISNMGSIVAKAPDADDRLKLAETTFKTIIDANKHTDDKASRILSAIAFLTAAVTTIYTRVLTTELNLDVFGLQVSASLMAFASYIIFVAVGSMFYIAALGAGALNLPSRFRSHDRQADSLLFFWRIARLKEEEWTKHWDDHTVAQLQFQMTQNYIQEARLVAQTVQSNTVWLAWGSTFFKLAILSLLVLAGALFAPDQRAFWFYSLLGAVLFTLTLLYEAKLRPSNYEFDGPTLFVAGNCVVFSIAFLSVALRLIDSWPFQYLGTDKDIAPFIIVGAAIILVIALLWALIHTRFGEKPIS
ncbi:MAG TPA: hypothetical protein VJ183_05325 [Chloroflexia bacterium]|nr:hypothetical protein [Chloroflexia bacterium]